MLHSRRPNCKLGLSIVTLLILARSGAFLWWPHVHFDADQAVTGLMAKHLAEGRAFPVFQYAQEYVLVIESWLAAPLVALSGNATPELIKSVPVALNLASGALLYHTLCRTLMLGSFAALIIVLPFAVPGVGTAGDLTDALGMNIEPLLFTVLLWHLRERPLLLGLTAAVAILNREFTLYALVALACVELMRDRWRVSVWRPHAVTAVAFVLVWSAVALLKQHSSPSGPGTMGVTGRGRWRPPAWRHAAT